MSSCSQPLAPPDAVKKPYEMTIHGDTRVDSYYWMRLSDEQKSAKTYDAHTQEVVDYINLENEYTQGSLAHTKKFQDHLFNEIIGRIKKDDETVPYLKNGYYYYSRYEEKKEYAIYCRKKGSLEAEEEVMLDGNELSEGYDYFAVGGMSVSPDNNWLAYGIDTLSRRFYTIYFKNLSTGNILEQVVPNTTGNIAWANDNKTLFYTVLDKAHRSYQLWHHELGNEQSDDVLVFQEDDDRFSVGLHRTKSGKFLKMDLESQITTEVYLLDRNDPFGEWKLVQPREQGVEYYVYHHGNYLYQITNKDAINFKMIRTTLKGRKKDEIIPNREKITLDDVSMFKNHMAVLERIDGNLEIRLFNFEDESWYNIEMNEDIYSLNFEENYDWNSDFFRFGYGSFKTPYCVYDIDFKTHKKTLRKKEEILGGYESENYVSERIWAPTHDGKKLAITLLYKKGIDLKGNNPCFLWGYGSYGATYDPWFSSNIFSLVDRGMVYARAHIRGSSFMGRKWYLDGKLKQKKNTFEDFISAGRFLENEGITSSAKLAIYGGSAGGLLIGAVMNMAPDLCKVAIPSVPFVDVINTMLDESIPLTVSEFEEWGNPKEKDYYDYMKSYSPYDNVEAKAYPHTLVLAGYNDPRVPYWEPAKWTAKLRNLKKDDNDLLLKTIMGAGHFSSSGRFDYLKDVAFYYAFILDKLEIN